MLRLALSTALLALGTLVLTSCASDADNAELNGPASAHGGAAATPMRTTPGIDW